MANDQSLDALKRVFNEGFEAFNTVVQNDKGIYNNPVNPYSPKSLLHKEWERGFNRSYFEQQKNNKEASI